MKLGGGAVVIGFSANSLLAAQIEKCCILPFSLYWYRISEIIFAKRVVLDILVMLPKVGKKCYMVTIK